MLARLVELCIAIARQSHVTLMQPKQLAICLGPNLVSSAIPDPRPVVDFLPLLSTLMTHRAGVFGAVAAAAAAEQPSSPAPQPTSIGWYQNQQDEKEADAGASGSGANGGARPLGSPPKTEAVEALDLSGVGDDIAPKKKKKDREKEKAAAAASAVTSPSVTFANSRAGAPDQMLQREEQQRRAAGTCGGQIAVQS